MTTQRRHPSIDHSSIVTAADPDAPPTGLGSGDAGPGTPDADAASRDDPWRMTVHPGPPVPPEMEVASVESVMDALNGIRLDGPWEAVADAVVPVLPRRRPMPAHAEPEVRWNWPPGLTTTFGIDLGPALLFITEQLAGRWGVDGATLADRSIRTITERLPRAIEQGCIHDSAGGLRLTAFQSGDGWASTLVLAPQLIPSVFGPDPAILLAPMRDLLVKLPIDADPGLATWMLDDFAGLDPNGLEVPLLLYEDGEVALFDPRRRRRRGRRGRVH